MSKLPPLISNRRHIVVALGALWGALGCSSSEDNPVSMGGTTSIVNDCGNSSAQSGGCALGGSVSGSGGGQGNLGGSFSSGGVGNATGSLGGSGAIGGSAMGGSAMGGSAMGGRGGAVTTGGNVNAGGNASGARPSGGQSSKASGGSQAGGTTATGGAPASGGTSTGGHATGANTSTGGLSSTGGNSGTPGVRIVGRTAPGTSGTRFSWPGVNISAAFTGTQVSMQLNDGNNGNTFEIVIDGGTPKKITTSGQSTIQLASGLSNGTHQLLIWRNTEPSYGVSEFIGLTGFGSGGALLPPPAAPDRRIEVIGDSISCGAGIEGSGSCSTTKDNENHYYSYGAVAARALGADLCTIAWSGIGMYRNYNENGPSANAMPARYPYAIPSDNSTTWDFAKYQPHAVVINLTSNDFSTKGDPGQPYVDAYVNFVKMLRTRYTNAQIFAVIQWSTSATAINTIVSNLKSAGDNKVSAFDIRPSAGGSGCSGHPNIAQSAAMGNALAAEIKRVLGW